MTRLCCGQGPGTALLASQPVLVGDGTRTACTRSVPGRCTGQGSTGPGYCQERHFCHFCQNRHFCQNHRFVTFRHFCPIQASQRLPEVSFTPVSGPRESPKEVSYASFRLKWPLLGVPGPVADFLTKVKKVPESPFCRFCHFLTELGLPGPGPGCQAW